MLSLDSTAGSTDQIQCSFQEGGRPPLTDATMLPIKTVSFSPSLFTQPPNPAPSLGRRPFLKHSWNAFPTPVLSHTFSFNPEQARGSITPLCHRQENHAQWHICSVTDIKQQAPETQADQTPNIKQIMMACVYKPSTGEGEAGRPEVQGHSRLHSKFGVSLGYMRPCPKAWAIVYSVQSAHSLASPLPLPPPPAMRSVHKWLYVHRS